MSQENVEIVHRLVGAWNGGNIDTLLGFFDPDCEVIFRPEGCRVRSHRASRKKPQT